MLKFMKPFVKYLENKITNKSPEKAAQVVIKDRERNGSVTDTVFKDLKTPIQKIQHLVLIEANLVESRT